MTNNVEDQGGCFVVVQDLDGKLFLVGRYGSHTEAKSVAEVAIRRSCKGCVFIVQSMNSYIWTGEAP